MRPGIRAVHLGERMDIREVVVLSGVIGRFIYIQIPRSIEGRELSLSEVKNMKTDIAKILGKKYILDTETVQHISNFTEAKYSSTEHTLKHLRLTLKKKNIPNLEIKSVLNKVKIEKSLSRKIDRLQKMQQLFKYWHVAHLPFALIMLIIVIIHVIITLAFGYKWIF